MAELKRVAQVSQHRFLGHLTIIELNHEVVLTGEWQKDRIENYQIAAVKTAAYQEVDQLATKLRRELTYSLQVTAETRTVITYEETLSDERDLAMVSDVVKPSWAATEIVTVRVPRRG